MALLFAYMPLKRVLMPLESILRVRVVYLPTRCLETLYGAFLCVLGAYAFYKLSASFLQACFQKPTDRLAARMPLNRAETAQISFLRVGVVHLPTPRTKSIVGALERVLEACSISKAHSRTISKAQKSSCSIQKPTGQHAKIKSPLVCTGG